MRRARHKRGSVVKDKRRGVWNYLYCDNGVRRTKTVGTLREYPTKSAAWQAVEEIRPTLIAAPEPEPVTIPTVKMLVEQYRVEKMPTRHDTRGGYESWLRVYILPKWGNFVLCMFNAFFTHFINAFIHNLLNPHRFKVSLQGDLEGCFSRYLYRFLQRP